MADWQSAAIDNVRNKLGELKASSPEISAVIIIYKDGRCTFFADRDSVPCDVPGFECGFIWPTG